MQNEQELIELVRASGFFDGDWYSETYPDVRLTNIPPLNHFVKFGILLNRDPGPNFSSKSYLKHYPDVDEAGIEAFHHYLISGKSEGRNAFPAAKYRIEALTALTGATESKPDIDIIVPVYNALPDVKNCLRSLVSNQLPSEARCIVVNDGSDSETGRWLEEFCHKNANFTLIKNEKNIGYTKSVNVGLRSSHGKFVILLNSDTIVSHGWIEGLLRCANTDPKVGIVGPLSNAASWQNVPELLAADRTFAVNALPRGMAVNDMAEIVRRTSPQRYPTVGFVNGFCFLIARSVIDRIGHMDEINFPKGYGEENDFCVRAGDAGFSLKIADDTYVYHAKSKSFGHETRKNLSSNASEVLDKIHSKSKINRLLDLTKRSLDLVEHRSAIRAEIKYYSESADLDIYRQKITFLLPAGPGGGGSHSVVQEASAMRKLGIQANVAIRASEYPAYIATYADIDNIKDTLLPVEFDESENIFIDSDIAIATIYSSVKYLSALHNNRKHILPAYYIQDYEPMFYNRNDKRYVEAIESYSKVDNAILFAKTEWICNKVREEHDLHVSKVQPSIDRTVYFPKRKNAGFITLAAMVRPQTLRRGAERTMELLKDLSLQFGSAIKVEIFGCDSGDAAFSRLVTDFPHSNYGVLTRPRVAEVLQQADIFFDLSDYQAFGRTALEAMACGATAIITKHGGVTEFAQDGYNSLLVDPTDRPAVQRAASSLIKNIARLRSFQLAAMATAARYSVSGAALSEISLFAAELIKHRQQHPKPKLRTLAIVPDTRGDKKPTGSAYVRTLTPYLQSGLSEDYAQLVCAVRELPTASSLPGVALLQRRLPGISLPALEQWADGWHSGGGRIVFDIDDDLLDRAGLIARHFNGDFEEMKAKIVWAARNADAVVVSTPYLAERMREFNSNVVVIPNYLDTKIWHLEGERPPPEVNFRRSEQFIRIGYVGTPTHDGDLKIVKHAVQRVRDEFGEKVRIEVIGAFENRPVIFGERIGLPKRTEYPKFVEWLFKRTHWDIGIIPLAEDTFNLSKSNLKFLECSALGMGLVVSDVPAYANVARHEENCLLANNSEDSWYNSIKRLIVDNQLRKKLETNARRDIAENHTTQKHLASYRKVLSGE